MSNQHYYKCVHCIVGRIRTELVESVSSSLLHLLYGVQEALPDDGSGDNAPAPFTVLHSVPWLPSGRHAVAFSDEGDSALVADLSTDGGMRIMDLLVEYYVGYKYLS